MDGDANHVACADGRAVEYGVSPRVVWLSGVLKPRLQAQGVCNVAPAWIVAKQFIRGGAVCEMPSEYVGTNGGQGAVNGFFGMNNVAVCIALAVAYDPHFLMPAA